MKQAISAFVKKTVQFIIAAITFLLIAFVTFLIISFQNGTIIRYFPMVNCYLKKPQKELFLKQNDSTIVYIKQNKDCSCDTVIFKK